MMVDADAKYLKSHEWVKQDGNVYSVGLSAYALEQLGDIVYIELPQVGTEYNKEDAFGVIESVKTASDLYIPLTGKVVQVNEELPDNPDILSKDAYGAGWLIKVEASDPAELETLLDAAAYKKFLETEA
ncbi:MAG: glycine cleavage system protein GcvH [Planctomycetota bacterium]|jgi:glycine cleavage system H protein